MVFLALLVSLTNDGAAIVLGRNLLVNEVT
jgi:hypothetical protein